MAMKNLERLKRLGVGAIAVLAIVLAANTPGHAQMRAGHGGGGHPGGPVAGSHESRGAGHPHGVRPGFDGHGGHHEFHGSRHVGRFEHGHPHFGVGLGFVPVFPDYGYYPYAAPPYESAPAYWYYCPSYGAYYPNVTVCPEAWVPVPAQ